MNTRMQHTVADIMAAAGAGVSGAGAITAFLNEVDIVIRILAGIVAIFSGIAAIIYYHKKTKGLP